MASLYDDVLSRNRPVQSETLELCSFISIESPVDHIQVARRRVSSFCKRVSLETSTRALFYLMTKVKCLIRAYESCDDSRQRRMNLGDDRDSSAVIHIPTRIGKRIILIHDNHPIVSFNRHRSVDDEGMMTVADVQPFPSRMSS